MTNRTSGIATTFTIGFLLGIVSFLVNPIHAQVGSANQYGLTDPSANPLEELQRRLMQSALSTSNLPMEGAVNPDEYIVGPGDIFSISIPLVSGLAPEISVGADGRLLLPDAGPVYIAGLTLAQARSIILKQLTESFQNTRVDIVLLQSRQFYVHVSGAVPKPGRFLALPVARVSTILEMAFADTTRTPISNLDFRPSLRNIRLIHVDGSEESVDLLQYFSSGRTHTNPYVQDGDVVYVPTYNPGFSSVYVDGAVLFPGPYDYRPDDTINSLISVAGGLNEDSGIENIRLRRESADGQVQIFQFDLNEITNGDEGKFGLKPRDHLSIAYSNLVLGSATIDGRAYHPGTYPIEDGVTTLRGLVEMADGLQPDALLRGAYLVRRSLPLTTDRGDNTVFDKPLNNLQQLLRADSTEIMQRLRMTDLDFLSRAYFAQEMRLQNRVSIDLEETMSGSRPAVFLRDGDRLVVPRDENSVYVFGQVQRPGFIEFQFGKDAEHYIADAGGRGEFASELYIIHPGNNAVERLGNQLIHSGDLIFIDRKTDIADNPELQRLVSEQIRTRSDARIRTMQTLLQSVATVASVVALVISISRN